MVTKGACITPLIEYDRFNQSLSLCNHMASFTKPRNYHFILGIMMTLDDQDPSQIMVKTPLKLT